ncbi:Lipoprotein-releasing system ATP-binding protein LolD [Anaerobiospirillum thomasii]|uniref:Lipoprotein-releasing system ATP-binding protein LolD n=1 Tax=Anaerobiospirillum thomasii TaxID=179995 RepID=A0A2X0VBH8_9GAMM|nr:ABC transporter ATP-binding protein [Anaerobiospirillum thomasii]SPT69627.1 Lipoprotein-releasing system ATP-binding protein LolD [Anaerobiospirillum thomasii]SPT71824.1 Lipoprotein-releasing system ATP-binding protein LolD [Anaerobiospirillum thomasii]
MIILKVSDLYKTYKEGKIETPVLRGVNLEIEEKKLCAITGPSGSGKSTLLHILGTLDSKSSGSIYFKEQSLDSLNSAQKARFRNRHLGFIYQFHHLLNDFSALENIMLPLLISGMKKDEAYKKACKMLELVALSDKKDNLPSELSGGQRQRVAIGRALINNPDIILADEPTGNLDESNAHNIFNLFESLVREMGTTVIMVTHDMSLAKRCDVIYKMSDGVVIS